MNDLTLTKLQLARSLLDVAIHEGGQGRDFECLLRCSEMSKAVQEAMDAARIQYQTT